MPCDGSPEFQIRIVEVDEDRSCTYGKWPAGGQFRFMKATDTNLDVAYKRNIEWNGEISHGGATFGYDVKCEDCGIELKGGVHILVRTSNINPFEEAWVYATSTIKAKIDFKAVLEASYEYEMEKDVIPDLCQLPVCIGGKLAGVGIQLGLVPSLKATLSLNFDAKLTLEYRREMDVTGLVAGHALRGEGLHYEFSKDVQGFEPSPVCVSH